jgi:hypothetical protein
MCSRILLDVRQNAVELSAVNGYTRVVQGFQGIGFVMNIVTVDSATCIVILVMERKSGLMKDFKTVMKNHTPLNWLLITVNTYSRVCFLCILLKLCRFYSQKVCVLFLHVFMCLCIDFFMTVILSTHIHVFV